MTTKKYQSWRQLVRIIEGTLVLAIPFIRIRGESALRFDIPSLKLHFFGTTLWMDEFFVVLTGTMFLTFLFLLATLLLGRIWCGWLCPQTVLNEITSFIESRKLKPFIPWFMVFIISILAGANLIWYFVSPYDFFHDLFRGELSNVTLGFWAGLTAILFINFSFIRYRFCSTVCPYAKLQGALYDDKTLVIAMGPDNKQYCIECLACVKTCPVNIDIRDGLNSACIACAKCIDACSPVMKKQNRGPLIDYFFGAHSTKPALIRSNMILTSLITIFFFTLTIYLAFTRQDIDVILMPNNMFASRMNESGDIVNSHILSLKNRGTDDLDIYFTTRHDFIKTRIQPDSTIHIRAGDTKKVPVYITAENRDEIGKTPALELLVINKNTGKILIEKEIGLISPGEL